MSHFPSGVSVMTTRLGQQIHGMTASAVCSVSLEPMLVLVCIEKVTRMHQLVSGSGVYAINILSERDEAISRFFADDARLAGPEFQEGDYRTGVTGCPLLTRATAHLEARVRNAFDGGDHSIFLGEVAGLEVVADHPPLVFYRGGYASLAR